MNWSFSLGNVAGTNLRVHATFFLLLAWVAAAAWVSGGPASVAVNVAFIVGVFACVMLHELGHALMARRFGIPTPDITLLPIGGLARLERIPEDPWQEILIAIAGPAVNVVIWAGLSLFLGTLVSLDALVALEDPAHGLVARLAAANLILFVFNLIPAFPMDGGRVFRAVLALYTDRTKATNIAAQVGQTMAFMLGFLGLFGGNPLLVLVAVFVFFAAGAESAEVAKRHKARHALAHDAMISSFEALSPDDPISAAEKAVLRTTQSEFPVVDADRKLVGILTRREILQVHVEQRSDMPVASVMHTDVPVVKASAPMNDALDAMQRSEVSVVAISDSAGRLLGYINTENIGEWFILARD